MLYWHVDKNSAAVFIQYRTCSTSEVSSMMKGVLQHDTEMDMDEIFVDTHGQSCIGFAFSHLLNFDLLPRIKGINKQKLFLPSLRLKKNFLIYYPLYQAKPSIGRKLKTIIMTSLFNMPPL